MKKITYLKSLLLAAGLCVGASAWADSEVVYGRAMTADAENGYTAWSDADVATTGSELNKWIGQFVYNETYGLYQTASGGRSSVMTFSHTANALQTFDIVFYNLGNTGNAGNYSYIKIGSDIEIQSNQQNQTGAVIINGNSTAITDCNQKNYNRGGDTWTIHIEINSAKKTVTALTIEGTPGTYGKTTKYAHYTLSSETALSSSATFNTVTIGFTRSGGTPAAALTSILIAEEAQVVTNADYTINYKFGESTVKTEEGTSTVGATINAVLPFTEAGQKYYAADGATTSITLVDGENILNVDLRKANEYAYSVKNNFGTSIASGTYVEGENAITVNWSKYVKNGEVWYECDEATFSTSISGALDKTVSYTTPTDIAYFVECENMNVSRSPAASDASSTYSNRTMVRLYSNSRWWTDALEGGVYDLFIPWKNSNSADNTVNIYLRDGEGNLTDTGLSVTGTKQSSGNFEVEGIVIPDGYSLVLNNITEYNSNVLMDYLTLTPSKVSTTITDAGWATLYTANALNFSEVENLTAYTATVSGNKVTLTQVDNVPAETGVILKGNADTYTIPVIASSTTAKGDLKGATADVTQASASTGNTIYVLNKVGENVGFYKLDGTLEAGRAYLDIPEVSDARMLTFVIEGETTAIANVKSVAADNGCYNLNGQRVAAPQKGLYIVNGKKVIVK